MFYELKKHEAVLYKKLQSIKQKNLFFAISKIIKYLLI